MSRFPDIEVLFHQIKVENGKTKARQE